MQTNIKSLLLCASVWLSLVLAAQSATPSRDRILQQELKQQQIRTSTQRVGDKLGTGDPAECAAARILASLYSQAFDEMILALARCHQTQ